MIILNENAYLHEILQSQNITSFEYRLKNKDNSQAAAELNYTDYKKMPWLKIQPQINLQQIISKKIHNKKIVS
jgi:hypothetical protein